MASELRVNTLKDASGNNSVATSVVANGSAKAWVNLNGDSTVSIRDSYNTSGVTDNGTGDYTFSWSSSMGNINYTSSGAAGQNQTALLNLSQPENTTPPATGSCRFGVAYENSNAFDGPYVGAVIHGDLA